MSTPGRHVLGTLPEPVLDTLREFERAFDVRFRLTIPPPEPGAAAEILYASGGFDGNGSHVSRRVRTEHVWDVELHVSGPAPQAEAVADVLAGVLKRLLEAVREAQLFTYELSERFEEINLLYSISETLGSTLDLEDGARKILTEVRDTLGARRGSLWVYDAQRDELRLLAEVGDDGIQGPLSPDHPDAITSMVFREGQAIQALRQPTGKERDGGSDGEPILSVPIRYSPAHGESRTVGVLNLIGRHDGGRFNAANQKLLSAIASQVGAALENHRLVRESISRERMSREMELAHDLQMKLLPVPERLEWVEAAGRIEPAAQVGGDFYQLFQLPGGKVGVMLGDVSLHGFSSALIMTLTMSAAGIYARESESPAEVLRLLDDALADELETTEMFLTVFYGVIDPEGGTLTYANAGHPHAFIIREDGDAERLTATDPPVGFAGADAYHERAVPWHPGGDLLLLFTDGLSDTLATQARIDGEALVLETATRNRTLPPARIVERLFALRSEGHGGEFEALSDDRTALVVRV